MTRNIKNINPFTAYFNVADNLLVYLSIFLFALADLKRTVRRLKKREKR